jgi:hypothetical protein
MYSVVCYRHQQTLDGGLTWMHGALCGALATRAADTSLACAPRTCSKHMSEMPHVASFEPHGLKASGSFKFRQHQISPGSKDLSASSQVCSSNIDATAAHDCIVRSGHQDRLEPAAASAKQVCMSSLGGRLQCHSVTGLLPAGRYRG